MGLLVMDRDDYLTIGRLESKIDTILEDQRNAREDRKRQYERQEATDKTLSQVASKVDRIEKRLEAVEGPVAQFNKWRERGIGAMMLVSMCGATIGALLTKYWTKLLSIVSG